MKGKVLLPLDASEASRRAFIPAKSIAEHLEMNLCILYISEEEVSIEDLLCKLQINTAELKDFVAYHRTGAPEKIIVEESESCDYIVMGTHGQTCDETKRMGSVTNSVIESTSKPILLFKPSGSCLKIENGRWMPQKILIPVSSEPYTSFSYEPAIRIIAGTSAHIDILHVYNPEDKTITQGEVFSAPYYEDYPQHEWSSWAKEFLKRTCPEMKNNFKIKVSLSCGEPAEEIVKFAENNGSELIVVVWHGSFAQTRAKVLKKLLSETDCPIMLMRA